MIQALLDRYRCSERYLPISLRAPLSDDIGFFQFGSDTICYGHTSLGFRTSKAHAPLYDVLSDCVGGLDKIAIPFDPTEVVNNLRLERYQDAQRRSVTIGNLAKTGYYLLRPLMTPNVRRYLQKTYLGSRTSLAFPAWPVDLTVENLCDKLLAVLIQAQRLEKIPFIWFWPDGATSCAIMTHDVETTVGQGFCSSLMDLDDQVGIKSSIDIVPEKRYEVSPAFVNEIWNRGFEVVVHDLNHDGRLFLNRREFAARVEKINSYGERFRASGFRSGALYRNQSWYGTLKFSYDMSVPNVGHLDPQRGGCCTVMPYFIGNIVELPVTMTQDYSLFYMLGDHTIDLWKQQAQLIMRKHGLMSFIVHPDYITQTREKSTYQALLGFLSSLRDERGIWIPRPSEVNLWWRQRAAMTIVEDGRGIRIEGSGKERARIAYASQEDGQLVFTIEPGNKAAPI